MDRKRFCFFLLRRRRLRGKQKTSKKNSRKKLQAKLARNEVSWIERVFSGETMEGRTPSLKEACAAEGTAPIARPTLGEFRHLTAVVASYAFHLPDDEGTDRTVLLPLLDLVNHANAGVANTVVAREGEEVRFVLFVSLRREREKREEKE